jgi:hypothetical protein
MSLKKIIILTLVIGLVLYSMTSVYFWYWFAFSTFCLLICFPKALSEN